MEIIESGDQTSQEIPSSASSQNRAKFPFYFEFIDQTWIPKSLHATLREVLEFHLEVTLAYYYRWAAQKALEQAEITGISRVIEWGAGAAGFSEALAKLIQSRQKSIQIEISDLHPDPERYLQLERSFPNIIFAHKEPVDVRGQKRLAAPAINVMSAAFHHIPPAERQRVLEAMASNPSLIFESVTRDWLSIIGCVAGFIPAILTPLYFLSRPNGRWRRFFWCWLVPVAPLMVAFDGVISCLRCWTKDDWKKHLESISISSNGIDFQKHGFSQMISWTPARATSESSLFSAQKPLRTPVS